MENTEHLLNGDPSGRLDLIVRSGHDCIFEFTHFEDKAAVAPVDFEGVHSFLISKDVNGTKQIALLGSSPAVLMLGNTITLDFTTVIDDIKPGEYFIGWKAVIDGKTVPIANGKILFLHVQDLPVE